LINRKVESLEDQASKLATKEGKKGGNIIIDEA